MTHTVESLMELADEYAGRSKLTDEGETRAREALRAALMDALTQQIDTSHNLQKVIK